MNEYNLLFYNYLYRITGQVHNITDSTAYHTIAHAALAKSSGGDPYPPDPGTRIHCYRCSLPGLTGFTISRRGGTGTGHHKDAHVNKFTCECTLTDWCKLADNRIYNRQTGIHTTGIGDDVLP